ncbi:putative deoxynucleoside monophosphate kinase [Cafeteria roenbergensis virus]|uniref:Putative deoxynucleoside monophosphate kinase n=1 Tax=Cafeteria roenbergensis virus (strain BV-PW1) TaxID=693272 RepID=E3T4K0_CROVB|nr:putative deoxynucleoside monophosphate kinase [Cafeteria roenbergensis virus BV-PW1]ADO67113.1 putative deoxynucleoside monophosphate kinase [Cafeteria roenbergensis virus BV-PW1]
MIIGISGLQGSGKDTLGKILITKYGFIKLSFAESLKDITSIIFNWDRQLIEGTTTESRVFREKKDDWWSTELNQEITPRKMLQYLGTDLFRDNFNQDIWVKIMKRKLIEYKNLNKNIVITDCRFLNEIQMIHKLGGIVIKIERDTCKPTISHSSETSLSDFNFDFTIKNNKTIDDLHKSFEALNLKF